MKYAISAFLALSLLAGCGEEKSIVKLEPSDEMRLFMQSLNGTTERVSRSLERWSDSEAVQQSEMARQPLANPTLLKHTIGTDGDCYHIQAEAHSNRRTYAVCWKNSKIASAEFVSMK